MFKTFMRHIASVKIFINNLMISHCDFYILNLKAIHHCLNNKALFKNLRTTYEVVKTVNDEVLKIEIINNIKIFFSNGEFLVFSEVMYISILMMNLIVISRLWHKDFDVLYSTDQSCKICLFSDQLMTNANMINNQWILRTTDFKVINAITITAVVTSVIFVKEIYIFAFAKLIIDVKVWHRRLIHVSYRNVLINAEKIIDMKNVIDFISETICESCMTGRSQQEQSRVLMTKVTEFIWKINVDIDIGLSIIFRDYRHFMLLKCDVIEFMWFYFCKYKAEIFKIVKNFKTFIELQTSDCKIRVIQENDEFLNNVFKDWFKKIGIQWKQSAFYTFDQNVIIKPVMYIVMTAVRSIFKAMKLSKSMWNVIENSVIYIKNRTIILNESDEEAIILFESVNDILSNISNLRALNCKVYTHVFKIFNCHKLNDRCWKGIHVDYDKNNQWKIYNFRIRTVHLTKDVKFDEKNIFYDEDINASQNFEDSDNESEIKKFWNFEDDFLLNVHSRRNWSSESKKIQTLMTSKSLLKNDNDDESMNRNDEIEKEKNFADATDLQSFLLFINVISKNIMSASQQTHLMRESLSDEQLQAARKEHIDELTNESVETVSDIVSISKSIASSINSSRKRDKVFTFIVGSDKDFVFITVDRSTCFKADKLLSMNYKKLHNSEERSKRTINYLNNLYNVKHIFNSHNHMQRVLNALMTEKNFGLEYVSESFIYKQALNSPFWSEWKKVMKHEIQCHDENGTWKFERLFNERFVIIGRWIFKIKYNVDD